MYLIVWILKCLHDVQITCMHVQENSVECDSRNENCQQLWLLGPQLHSWTSL